MTDLERVRALMAELITELRYPMTFDVAQTLVPTSYIMDLYCGRCPWHEHLTTEAPFDHLGPMIKNMIDHKNSEHFSGV